MAMCPASRSAARFNVSSILALIADGFATVALIVTLLVIPRIPASPQMAFFRSIHLPKKVDTDKVKAKFKNGMLTLKAAIAEEARAKTVAIDAA